MSVFSLSDKKTCYFSRQVTPRSVAMDPPQFLFQIFSLSSHQLALAVIMNEDGSCAGKLREEGFPGGEQLRIQENLRVTR